MLLLTRNLGERIFIDGTLIHREEGKNQRNKPVKASPLKLSKGHVLLVEDNPVIQKMHRIFLEKLGYTVDIADNGKKALKMSKDLYNLILMDLGLPDVSGIDVIKAIRKRKKCGQVPILVLTTCDEVVVKKQCLDIGANGFQSKPLSIEKLDESMQVLLNNA